MLYLDSENHKDMQLYINCSGGEVSITLSMTLVALVRQCREAHTVISAIADAERTCYSMLRAQNLMLSFTLTRWCQRWQSTTP